MYRVHLILIVVFGSSSVGLAQTCPGGRCCQDSLPAGPRSFFGSDTVREPNNLFERTEERVEPRRLPRWDMAPAATDIAPRPRINLPAQRLCPVTGEELGSMGPPIPVTVKGQTIQVCCKACVSVVQRDPDRYLQKVAAELRDQTPKAPANQLQFGGQRLCPVTGQELGSMGPPIPVTVSGRTVYVCCRACVNALQRNPAKYLGRIDSERKFDSGLPSKMAAPTRFESVDRVSTRWGGQTTCPVTGDVLGEMGEPIPVRVADRTIFVCCESCVAAVRRNPDTYIRRVDAELATRRPVGEPIN